MNSSKNQHDILTFTSPPLGTKSKSKEFFARPKKIGKCTKSKKPCNKSPARVGLKRPFVNLTNSTKKKEYQRIMKSKVNSLKREKVEPLRFTINKTSQADEWSDDDSPVDTCNRRYIEPPFEPPVLDFSSADPSPMSKSEMSEIELEVAAMAWDLFTLEEVGQVSDPPIEDLKVEECELGNLSGGDLCDLWIEEYNANPSTD